MSIGKNKKRYYVTLTPAHVDRFQGLCKRLSLPPATMSNALDDVLIGLSEAFEMALEKKEMKVSDIINLMGKQIGLIEEEEKERKTTTKKEAKHVPEQKRRTVRNSKNAR